MPPDRRESDLLRQSWQQYDIETLDKYLVEGVEDPRINVPSILTRAMLCDAIFPSRYSHLIEEELRFGFVMTWLAQLLGKGIDKASIRTAVREKRKSHCPGFVLETAEHLQTATCPIPDYLSASLDEELESEATAIPDQVRDVFQQLWRDRLSDEARPAGTLFEAACGSANDYRYLESCHLARFCRYTGIDIAPKNIVNARRRWPAVDFQVGDLLDNGFADNSFDFSFVHDLFEHLSGQAIERGLQELIRVTGCEAWLHLFNAAHLPEHSIRPVETYHWNTLSIDSLVQTIERAGGNAEVLSIAELANVKFRFTRYYNPGAYLIIVRK